MNRQRLISLAGIAIGVVGIGFVIVKVVRDRDDFADALTSANPTLLVLATLSGIAAITAIAANWVALLAQHDLSAGTRRAMGWFYVGQMGKYVPGGIWPIVGQAELARRGGVGRGPAYGATATSMLATFLGAVTLAAGAGLVVSERRFVAVLLVLALVVGFACLSSKPVRVRAHEVILAVTKRPLELPDGGALARLTVRHLPVWVMFSLMNVLVVVALGGSPDSTTVLDLAVVTCLSWMAGFVIVGLPGGIGVREAVFVSMTTAALGPGLAVSVAVVSRLVSILVDLVAAVVTVPVARTGRRRSVPSSDHVAADQADDPDSVLQRGGDAAADHRRSSP